MINPIYPLFKKYPKLNKNEIIAHIADWTNQIGEEVFNDVVKKKIIKIDKHTSYTN